MMTGLYKSDFNKDLYTAEEIIKLKPDTVRIYPTVVLKNTHLAYLQEIGEYTAPTAEVTAPFCSLLIKSVQLHGAGLVATA